MFIVGAKINIYLLGIIPTRYTMRFYNREREIALLRNLKKYRVAIMGRRRVGKTRLVEEFFSSDLLTLFVSAEKSEKELISTWCNTYPGEDLPQVATLREFFRFLFEYKQDKIIFIDEAQNIIKVNKSFLSDLQRFIDSNPDVNIIITGSLISTMKDVVTAMKSPLFGRFDLTIKLEELDFKTVAEICQDLGLDFETTIQLYSIFGGIPKYYELLERLKVFDLSDFIRDMFVYSPRPLYGEVRTMLREEFGNEHRTLFSILSAVAQGRNRMSEIAGFLGRKTTDITKYIQMLREDFEILRRVTPALYGKRGIYEINTNIVDFWFANIWKYQQYLEVGNEEKLSDIIEKNINKYIGRKYEEIIIELCRSVNFGFDLKMIGRQWGTMKGKPKGENQYEIDLVMSGQSNMIFGECKWSNRVDARKIAKMLDEKVQYIDTHGNNIQYAIFVKDFSRRITTYKGNKVDCFDLEDIKNLIFDYSKKP